VTTLDRLLVVAALLAGLFFVYAIPQLWPLPDVDLNLDRSVLQEDARAFLVEQGFDVSEAEAAVKLRVERRLLDHLEETFPRDEVQAYLRDGHRVYYFDVLFKQAGQTATWRVDWHPEVGPIAWRKAVPDDAKGDKIDQEEARRRAVEAVERGLGLDLDDFKPVTASTTNKSNRNDHQFTWRRRVTKKPRLDQRVSVSVRGGEVTYASHTLEVPARARRAAKSAQAPRKLLEAVGFFLLAVGAVIAFLVFLTRLQSGGVKLGPALRWTAVVLVCLVATTALRQAWLFGLWEPLWPRWVSNLVEGLQFHVHKAWVFLVILAVIAAGGAIDRETGNSRGASLWRLSAGELAHPSVAAAAARGFGVGLVAGAVFALVVFLEVWLTDGRIDLQPRFYFLTVLNAASPAWMSLIIFLPIALGEELGYRLFLGTWLESRTGRRWVAILVPALIYGLVHTDFSFLPPEHPWWGRAVAMTAIGIAWGWAFFRYDALTVVLSHWTADLLIYNWPRLASGRWETVVPSILVVLVPLLPVAAWLIWGRRSVARPVAAG